MDDKFSRLEVIQKEISSLLLEDKNTHSEFETDFEAAESYRDSYLELKTNVEASVKSSRGLMKYSSTDNAPKLKLPKFELKKFSGDPKEFLTFWSIFSKIHESDDLTEVDKFQYLYQCMVPESRAARLVSSFPITTENYSKARFGREELLVQIYVRDFLSLVMKNAVAGRNSPDLATLYDMLETKLRALESLGRTKEKFADFLEPLVESCLPESVLRAWERSRISGVVEDSTSQRSLEKLMSFLRHEVESEETIKLAREGFVKNGGTFKRNKSAVLDTTDTATTAMQHVTLMCLGEEEILPVKTNESTEVASNLSNNNFHDKVYLQTVCVEIVGQGSKMRVRGLLDSASSRSYVSDRVVNCLDLRPLRHEKVIHGMFGGKETRPIEHGIYALEIQDLNGSFSYSCEVFSERRICGFVPKIEDPQILQILRVNNIELSDVTCNENEIDLLIGADLIGKLLTGRCVQLNFGLTAIHTKLGWTVIGKETGLYTGDDYPIMDSVQTVLSLYLNNASLRELWDIESLGIREPIENVSKRKAFDEQLKEFHEKLTVLPDGRYEVELPWKLDARTNLPDNKDLTLKRQEKAMSRASNRGYLDEYQKIFNEWENLKIIERVPDLEINKNSHYLPHRPVIKNSSETTKVRPVFDASAREKGKPSLNQCLFTGPN
uniref:Uncharacterized protein n=1 Tax=Araneus ventricosus TaxID=182803 RepID=A0A4Y2L7Q7_ARAVE|nr:hypothetical protein AVEN_37628-1 [Araneus ventricosus]GBN10514.1 hypothetical protein AVEN_149737-1 [Araneus ventricosus]